MFYAVDVVRLFPMGRMIFLPDNGNAKVVLDNKCSYILNVENMSKVFTNTEEK